MNLKWQIDRAALAYNIMSSLLKAGEFCGIPTKNAVKEEIYGDFD